jgi:RNA polymerase sigma factor (sigma-70 family)
MDSSALDLPEPSRASPEELLAHAVWVRKLARALVLDDASAEDLAQDALVAALQHPPRTDQPLRPWFTRVVRNLATSKRRQDVRRSDREHTARVEREVSAPDDLASSIEMQRMLLDAVESLRDPLRSTLVRHYFHGQTSAEIATRDGIADATVRWRLRQAIDALRTQLDARHRGDRRAWSLLLFPLANFPRSTAAPQPWIAATTGAIGTMLAMNVLVKAACAAALVIVVGWGLWKVTDSRPLSPVESSARTSAATLEDVKAESTAPTSSAERVAVTLPAAPATGTLAPATDYEATVEGRVIDARGLPVVNATLICVDRLGGSQGIERDSAPKASSGADGRVRLVLHKSDTNPRRGRPAGQRAESWQTMLDAESSGHVVVHLQPDLQAGTTTALGDVVLADAGDLVGRVVDAAGQGVEGASVQLLWPELTLEERDRPSSTLVPMRGSRSTRSDADGGFRMPGVPVGTFRVWATHENCLASYSDVIGVARGVEVRVADLRLLENDRAIRGIVLDEQGNPSRCLFFDVADRGLGSWIGENVAKDGTFLIEEVDPRCVDIYAQSRSGADALVRDVAPGTRDVVVQLRTRPTLELLVTDEHDKPIEVYTLGRFAPNGSGESGEAPRPAGKSTIEITSRPLLLTISAPGFDEEVRGPITADTAPTTLLVKLRAAARVTGKVIVADPIVEQCVEMVEIGDSTKEDSTRGFSRSENKHGTNQAMTAPDGTFTLDCPSNGRFVVVARRPGFATAQSRTLNISPTARGAAGIELRFTEGGAVAGRLITRKGDKSAGCRITASRGFGADVTTIVDETGHFRIGGLTAGRWWIGRTSAGLMTAKPDPQLKAGNPTLRAVDILEGRTLEFDLDVTDTPPVTIAGHLRLAGTATTAWTASVLSAGEWSGNRITQGIGVDGSFRFEDLEPGHVSLTLRSASARDRDERIDAEFDLNCGENVWSLDVACGELDVEGPALAHGALLSHVRRFENGSVMITRFRSRGGHPLVLANVPLGPATIVDASGKALGDVESKSGERARVIWR